MKLNPDNVTAVFQDCLSERPFSETAVAVEGIMSNWIFNSDKLAEHHDEIAEMLDQLPTEFKSDAGGGWSFLNACYDRDGNQWTGMPREMWEILPGGMPYVQVHPERGRVNGKH